MIIEQKMPALSPTMTEGTLIAWHIKPGDKVKSGQLMAEIQTDKSTGEWNCLDAGTVAELIIPAGASAKVNMIAAVFTTKDGEDAKPAIAKAKETNAKLASEGGATAPAPAMAAPTTAAAAAPAATPAPTPVAAPAAPSAPAAKVRISPVASRMAAAARVDVGLIKGTGPDGRVVRRDIEKAIADGSAKIGTGGAAAPVKPKPKLTRADGPAPVTDVPMSPMRAAIGRRLLESKTQLTHFYITERIDAGRLVALREELIKFDGVRVTINDLVVRATALALRLHPKVNSTLQGGVLKQHDSADISIAVAIPDGLITPILFKAHTLSVRQIGKAIGEMAEKAKTGKLKPAEYDGGSFTISNLGMYGIEQFNAIINPPQCAILAVGGIKDEPVVANGAVVPGKTLKVTLSADHRVVDGAVGAEFVRTLRELLEAPSALLI